MVSAARLVTHAWRPPAATATPSAPSPVDTSATFSAAARSITVTEPEPMLATKARPPPGVSATMWEVS